LDLLCQSSSAGGIIDAVNPGLLSVPDAALGTQALSGINIPFHPLTIAGYFGLVIIAINLLPVGSKYLYFFKTIFMKLYFVNYNAH